MNKNKLLKKENNILRVLELKEDSALIINCVRQDMPKWVSTESLQEYERCEEGELTASLKEKIRNYVFLTQKERRIAHERFTLVASVIPFITDTRKRCQMIA